jgi:hypothetical protein
MLSAAAKLVPATRSYLRQIIPPVLATLIAALLIAGFNRAFSGHLVQPRMAALHSNGADEAAPAAANTPKMREAVPESIAITITEPVTQRVFVKDNDREAGKDQTALKVAAAPAALPVPPPAAPRIATRKAEPPIAEPRQFEPRPLEPRVAAVPVVVPPPVTVAPAPVIAAPIVAQPAAPVAPGTQPVAPMMQPVAQEPPPVIAAKPMVTVPDRPRPAYEPQQPAEQGVAQAPAPRQNESFVDALRPSSIFNRMREFGDRIEAAGNEILPTIRQ